MSQLTCKMIDPRSGPALWRALPKGMEEDMGVNGAPLMQRLCLRFIRYTVLTQDLDRIEECGPSISSVSNPPSPRTSFAFTTNKHMGEVVIDVDPPVKVYDTLLSRLCFSWTFAGGVFLMNMLFFFCHV